MFNWFINWRQSKKLFLVIKHSNSLLVQRMRYSDLINTYKDKVDEIDNLHIGQYFFTHINQYVIVRLK